MGITWPFWMTPERIVLNTKKVTLGEKVDVPAPDKIKDKIRLGQRRIQ